MSDPIPSATEADGDQAFRERNRFWSRGDRFGRYEVEAEIGTGAVGRVYRARDPMTGRLVAIKTLRTEYLPERTSALLRRRFQVEAQAAGGLTDPSVVRVYDQGEDHLVMEYVDGSLLSAVLRARWVGLEESLAILSAIGGALDDAHVHHIVHRDVKPQNVMVTADGGAKLLDFGRAQLPGETCVGDRFLGNPSYMAPEQIVQGDATALSDLFSLAAVAYEMLTGYKPFPGDNIGSITYRVVYEAALPPTHLNPSLPGAYDEIFERMLAKDPARRLSTASAFLNALEAHRMVPRATRRITRPAAARVAAPPPPAGAQETQDLGTLRWIAVDAPITPNSAPLSLSSDPVGSAVWVDGIRIGSTPVVVGLDPGDHTLRVIGDGFAPMHLRLTVAAGAPVPPLHITLEPVLLPERRVTTSAEVEAAVPLFTTTPDPTHRPS